MKIAILPLSHRALPTGGANIFAPGVLAMRSAEELHARGHQVTLYAPKDSEVQLNLESFDLTSMFSQFKEIRENNPALFIKTLFQYELFVSSGLAEKSHLYDIIHAHDYRKMIYFSRFLKCPIIYTYHGCPLDDCQSEIDIKRFQRFYDNNFFIAASQRQVDLGKKFLNFIDVVPHGVDINKIPFEENPFEDILFVGRLMKRKRPDIAIKIAQILNKPIQIIGDKVSTPEDLDFFEKVLRPLLEMKNVCFKGIIPYPEVYKCYGAGKVLLFPIEWEEPFGMVLIEAMAAGTPVIAFKMGSVAEIVKDGETGFICPAGDIEAMVKAVKRIYDMPEDDYIKMRQNCRRRVEENFTVGKMVDGYERAYQKVIEDWKKKNG